MSTQWTESHRPTTLAGLALEDGTRNVLQSYMDAGEAPHLLFVGPPGSGKTTLCRILIRALDCRHLTLNASSERGIDVVRDKIGTFIAGMTPERWRIVFLDEADALTGDAQTALRNMIESHADRSRFFLTCNRSHKIIPPIQSRCQLITLGAPPLQERYRVLAAVLAKEGITAQPEIIFGYVERFPDLRKMLWVAQHAHLAAGKTKELPPAKAEGGANGAEILALIEAGNFLGLRRLTTSGAFDPSQSLRDAFWAVPLEHPRAGFLLHILGKGYLESAHTIDPVVLFLGVAAEITEGLKA